MGSEVLFDPCWKCHFARKSAWKVSDNVTSTRANANRDSPTGELPRPVYPSLQNYLQVAPDLLQMIRPYHVCHRS